MKIRKSLTKKIAAIAMILVLLFSFAGCSLSVADPIVAKVGNINIYASEFYSLYQSYYYYASMFGYDLSTANGLHEYQDWVLDTLIQNAILVYYAYQEGFEFTETELLEIQADAEAAYDDALASYKSLIDSAITDEDKIRSEQEALLKADLEANGSTIEEYKDELYDRAYDDAMSLKLRDQISSAAVVEDSEVQEEYDSRLETQQETYDETPSSFYTAFSNFASNPTNSDQPLYVPAGYVAVKHILIKVDTPTSAETTVDSETKDYDAICEEIETKIAEIEAGTSSLTFDDLIELYNEDEGLDNEYYSEFGYFVHEEIVSRYSEPFGETALALENVGDISERIQTEHGYHYIQLIAKYDEGTVIVSYEDAFDSIYDTLFETAGNDLIQAFIDSKMETTPITRYTSRIRAYA